MSTELSPDQLMLRDTVRRFVSEQVTPAARQWDKAEVFPHAVIEQLAELGLLGMTISPDYEGAGYGAFESALVIEELARGDGSVALTVALADDLTGREKHEVALNRPPKVTKTYDLKANDKVTFKVPYGGLIYIKGKVR